MAMPPSSTTAAMGSSALWEVRRASAGVRRVAMKLPAENGTSTKPAITALSPRPYPLATGVWTKRTASESKRYMPTPASSAATSAVKMERCLMRRSCTSGSAERNSHQIQKASSTTVAARSPSTAAEPHPQSSPSEIPSSRVHSNKPSVTAPTTSSFPPRAFVEAGSTNAAMASATTATMAPNQYAAVMPPHSEMMPVMG